MTAVEFDPDILEAIYPGCLEEATPVFLDEGMPIIDASVEEKEFPPFPVFSSTEALIIKRGLRNHLGVTYIGARTSSGKEYVALDVAANAITQVAGFILHATRSLDALAKLSHPVTGIWKSARNIKTSSSTPVLAELILADESIKINDHSMAENSPEKRVRLVEMFEALGEMPEVKLHGLCVHGKAVHLCRRAAWGEELTNARPHQVMHDIIQRERERRVVVE